MRRQDNQQKGFYFAKLCDWFWLSLYQIDAYVIMGFRENFHYHCTVDEKPFVPEVSRGRLFIYVQGDIEGSVHLFFFQTFLRFSKKL